MIASGGVYAVLRSHLLKTIPADTRPRFGIGMTLGEWISAGAFSVTSCTDKRVVLHASHQDLASVLVAEIESFIDHSFEHFQELLCYLQDERFRSDAWATVTSYYFGFFSASALLRLIGKPIVFLLRDQLQDLKTLAGAAKCPSQGSFLITLGTVQSATHIEVIVEPSEKSHEAVWKTILGEIEKINLDQQVQKSVAEAAFFSSLCSKTFFEKYVGFDWVSAVRNRANYRPGFAYTLDRKLNEVLTSIHSWRAATPDQIYNLLVNAERSLRNRKNHFPSSVTLMVNISFTLFLLMRALHRELWERKMTDPRWEKRRRDFVRRAESQNADFQAMVEVCRY